MTWKELNEKYPMDREEMTVEQEKDFVDHCFDLYENQGFAKVFWSISNDFKEYHNKAFKVINRLTEKECDLCCLPMWKIKFEDGKRINAYLDEIIPSEMVNNGCKLEIG